MREIGGYLEFENLQNCEYHNDSIGINTARNALAYLIMVKKISKIYLPYYLCDSVYKICEREKVDYEFYNVNEDFIPRFDKILKDREYIYIVNYFGQFNSDKIKYFKEKYKSVIIDNVQAFFEKPVSGVYTIYSCRKFFGVPDGAYLSGDVEKNIEIETDISMDRMKHLLGRFEGGKASDYYKDFQENDQMFENLPLKYMSKLTRNILGAINYDKVIKIRNKNWKYLDDFLRDTNRLTLIAPEGPYMYPYYCKNGSLVRRKLAEKKIYIPTLWQNVFEFEGCELEKDYVENILPLPIDQRYSEYEMKIIIDEIKKVIKED